MANKQIRIADMNPETLSLSERLLFGIYRDSPPQEILGKVSPKLFTLISIFQWFDVAVLKHAPLVWAAMRDHYKWMERLGIDSDEVFQVGNEALLKAARLYDHASGVSFGSYARPRVAGEILKFLNAAQAKFEGNRHQEWNPHNMNEALVERIADNRVSPALADLRQGLKDVREDLTNLQADTLDHYLNGQTEEMIADLQCRSRRSVRQTMQQVIRLLKPHVL